MFEYAARSNDVEPGSKGLGTVVLFGNERLIVTHDHWSHLTPNLKEVEFRDCQGKLLLTLDAQAFEQLIVYKDSGTMVLKLPAELEGLVASELGGETGIGDIVYIARRAHSPEEQSVEFIQTVVSEVKMEQEPAKLLLKNLNGSPIQFGDSGGGVWANGRFVANVWAAGMMVNMSKESAEITDENGRPTDLVVAALQPLGRKLGIELLTPEIDETIEPVLTGENNEEVNPKNAFLEETLLDE